jgi:hypothetical protein
LEDVMLDTYLVAPNTLKRLRSGPSGVFIDDFDGLKRDGYSAASAIRYLRAADHLGRFMLARGGTLADTGPQTPELFFRHLPTCTCLEAKGGKTNHHVYFGAKRFREYLIEIGVCEDNKPLISQIQEPAIVGGFRRWLQKHRGAKEPTIRLYCRDATVMLKVLGNDVNQWDPKEIRTFLLNRACSCGAGTAEKRVTSARALLRYLGVQDLRRPGLGQAVPSLAHWRLATLPRCLSAEKLTA